MIDRLCWCTCRFCREPVHPSSALRELRSPPCTCARCVPRGAAHRRSLSNLETIVGFAALLRSRGPEGSNARTARGSIAAAADMLRFEQMGCAPPGGVGGVVAAALDRQRRGVR